MKLDKFNEESKLLDRDRKLQCGRCGETNLPLIKVLDHKESCSVIFECQRCKCLVSFIIGDIGFHKDEENIASFIITTTRPEIEFKHAQCVLAGMGSSQKLTRPTIYDEIKE